MKFFPSLIAAALLSAPLATHASDSLFDPMTARPLSKQFRFQFGPKSTAIRYDARMIHAAEIAQERARAHSTSRCWHYVKDALVAAHVVSTRPVTEYAKEAGDELTAKFGFKKLKLRNPSEAPVGAVCVYGGSGPGHVEIRTRTGFVSDFFSAKPYLRRPLIGIFVPPRSAT